MSEIKDGGPAFPGVESPAGGYPGMSLRDYFAAQTVAALADTTNDQRGIDIIAARAYRIADALLKAREERS